MKVNKINFLMISLFLNNIKSVKLVSQENGGVYKYQDRQQTLIPQKLQNETDWEYNIKNYNALSGLPSKLLELFISEMKYIQDDSTFDIADNDNKIFQYKVTNKENIISIRRINDPITNPITNQYSGINHTVLALLHMNHIQSFLVKNATIDSNCPNSNFYIHDNDCLAVNTINSSYYIFPKNNITLIKNIPEIRPLFEAEETITCYEKCKNFSRDWMPTIAVIAAIVVPLAGKKIKQE